MFYIQRNYTWCVEDPTSLPVPASRYCLPTNAFAGGAGPLTIIILIVLSLVVLQGTFLGCRRYFRRKEILLTKEHDAEMAAMVPKGENLK
jgi:hypothetical protein